MLTTKQIITNNYYALEECLSDKPRMAMLSRYMGFGGAKPILHYSLGCSEEEFIKRSRSASDGVYYHDFKLLESLLYKIEAQYAVSADELLASIQRNLFTQFYTPQYIPDALFESLNESQFQPNTFLDPCAGSGIYIDSFLHHFPKFDKITAIEIDPLTSILLKAKYHELIESNKLEVINESFHLFNSDTKYDLIASNVPFSNYKVFDKTIPLELSKSLHSFYFAKAANLLSKQGVVSFLAPSGILNNSNHHILRSELVKNFNVIQALQFPNNLFDTTQVNSALITFTTLDTPNINDSFALKPLTLDLELDGLTSKTSINQSLIYSFENNKLIFNQNVLSSSHIISLKPYGKPNFWYTLNPNQFEETITNKISADIINSLALYKETSIALNSPPPVDDHPLDTSHRIDIHIKDKPTEFSFPIQVQPDLFSDYPLTNPALPYLKEPDVEIVNPYSSKLILSIKINSKEALVLIAATIKDDTRYAYKFCCNTDSENLNSFSANWFSPNFNVIDEELNAFLSKLAQINEVSSVKYSVDYSLNFSTNKLNQLFFLYTQKGYFKPYNALDKIALNTSLKEPTPISIEHPKTAYFNSLESSLKKEQSHHIFQGTVYVLNKELEPTALKPSKLTSFLKDYIELRNTYYEFLKHKNYSELNAVYDSFVEKHNILNNTYNKRKISTDYFGSEILSLETRFGNTFKKSSIFFAPIYNEFIKYDSLDTAFNASINQFNGFNLPFLIKHTDASEEDILAYFKDKIILDIPENVWKLKEHVLTGNLYDKVQQLHLYKESHPELVASLESHFDTLIHHIESNIPTPIPFNEIGLNLGERWIDLQIYNQFISTLFEDPKASLQYNNNIDHFSINNGHSKKATNDFIVRSSMCDKYLNGYHLMELALKSEYPEFKTSIKHSDGTKETLVDSKSEIEAKNIINSFRSKFVEFLFSLDTSTKIDLQHKYNYLFNNTTTANHSNIYNLLNFSDIHYENLAFKELKENQKKAVYFNLMNKGGINHHEVGLGKTMIMCVSSHEMNRMNVSKKNMILCLKANVAEIAHTYSLAYPHDKLLFPNEKDFSKNIEQYLFEIKNNDFDTIIMSHEMFLKIPQNDAIYISLIEDESKKLKNAILLSNHVSSSYELSARQKYGLETRLNNLKSKMLYANVRLYEKKISKSISFEDLNIGHIFVDEAHIFKNLSYVSVHDRVKGLSPQTGSERANNLLTAIRTLQHKNNSDFCATFLTGTPLSNSIVEMYSLFNFLNPSELKFRGLEHFDAWASSFCTKSIDFEYTMLYGYKSVERFREFNKIPELSKWYHNITDYCDATMSQIDRPDKTLNFITIKPNEEQNLYYNYLKEFAENGQIEALDITAKNDKSIMLEAMTMARLLSVDSRLIDPNGIDNPNSKVNKCVDEVLLTYKETSHFNGTQIIFSDLGVPNNKRFDVYQDIKNKLMLYGVPEHEIAFIHDATTDSKKQELFDLMNRGEVRVLLGSSSKAGTGLNVQRLLVRNHHLDIPWTPRHFEQRDGRGQRTGNLGCKNFRDNLFISTVYGIEQSPDILLYNTVLRKQHFISQVCSNRIKERSFDVGSVDENGMSQQEFLAQLSGNNLFLDKVVLERQINELEVLKQNFVSKVKNSATLVEFYEINIPVLKRDIPILEDTLKRVLALKETPNPLSLVGLHPTKETLVSHYGSFFKENFLNYNFLKADDTKQVGSIYEFPIFLNKFSLFIQINDFKLDVFNENYLNLLNFSDLKLAKCFQSSLDSLSHVLEQKKAQLLRYEADLPSHLDISKRTLFDKEQDLIALKVKLEDIVQEIKKLDTDKDKGNIKHSKNDIANKHKIDKEINTYFKKYKTPKFK